MFDSHTHTLPFSTDSSMTINEVLKKQKELSIGIILTEHKDFAFYGAKDYSFIPDEYFKSYLPYRNDQFLLGLEIGMQTQVVNDNQRFIKSAPFDMVIASVHAVSGFDLYEADFFAHYESKEDAYKAYLQANLENVRLLDNFDTLGHIDYVCRQAPYQDPELYYTDFPAEIDALLTCLIQKEKALELNTRRLGNPASAEALLPVYKRYHELGGKYITLGSDAHTASAIGAYFPEAAAFADTCSLTPVYFKNRTMQYL